MTVVRHHHYRDNGELIAAAHELGHVRGRCLDATFGKGIWWKHRAELVQVTSVVGMDLVPFKARRALALTCPYCEGPGADVPCEAACGSCSGTGRYATAVHADYRRPPFRPQSFDTVLYDPRYKLNGTPTPDPDGYDERYGADAVKPWRQIIDELLDGIAWWPPCVHCKGTGEAPHPAPAAALSAAGLSPGEVGAALARFNLRITPSPCGHCRGPRDLPGRGDMEGLATVVKLGGTLLVKLMDQVCSQAMRWQARYAEDRAREAGLELVDLLQYAHEPRKQPEGRRQVHAAANYSTLLIFKRGHG